MADGPVQQKHRAYAEQPMVTGPEAQIGDGGPLADGHPPTKAASAPGTGVILVLALAWLVAMLSSTVRSVGRVVAGDDIALVSAALALPGVVSAVLVAGAAAGLTGVTILAARRTPTPRRRLLAGAVGGFVVGAAVAVPAAVVYDQLPYSELVAVTVGAAGVIGSGIAAIRPAAVAAAGVAGALGVYVTTLLLTFFSPDLLHLYGAGDTGESRFRANAWLALTMSLLSGLVAGLLAYAYLRRGRTRGLVFGWPSYLVAGAGAGLLAGLAEALTRLGGLRLLQAARAVSAEDRAYLGYLDSARINRAMVILFVGAITALVLLGRTLRPAGPDSEAEPDGEPGPDSEAGPDESREPAAPGSAAGQVDQAGPVSPGR